jgi:hypothetical protein
MRAMLFTLGTQGDEERVEPRESGFDLDPGERLDP